MLLQLIVGSMSGTHVCIEIAVFPLVAYYIFSCIILTSLSNYKFTLYILPNVVLNKTSKTLHCIHFIHFCNDFFGFCETALVNVFSECV